MGNTDKVENLCFPEGACYLEGKANLLNLLSNLIPTYNLPIFINFNREHQNLFFYKDFKETLVYKLIGAQLILN